MPQFKTTYNILTEQGTEYWDPNWMDSNTLIVPPKKNWDYKREMVVDDVDIWEVLCEIGGGVGAYAAWSPYAEFYLITAGWLPLKENQKFNDLIIETYYGPGIQSTVENRMKELGMIVSKQEHWIEPEDLWLYSKEEPKQLIFIPDFRKK